MLHALVPLAEMIGYSTHLRSITHGEASFTMVFNSYSSMSGDQQTRVLRDHGLIV